MSVVFTLLAAVFAGALTSLITGWLARPKTKADAGLAVATGEVAISGDAREWAREFAARAARAEEKATAAEQRVDGIENKLDIAIRHIRDQQREIERLGGHPLPVPPELIPPL